MDLNKDNRDIYTVDAETYSEYMHDNWKKPTDFLSSFIKILLVILVLVVSYFFYKIVKADLSFSEVFNKQELLSTYQIFENENKEIYIEKEDHVELLANNISADLEEPKKKPVLAVTKKYDEPMVTKVEKEEVPIQKVERVEQVIVEEKVVVLEEPKPVKIIEEMKEEKIVESEPVEILIQKEVSEETTFSETYLDLMVAELNSL